MTFEEQLKQSIEELFKEIKFKPSNQEEKELEIFIKTCKEENISIEESLDILRKRLSEIQKK